MRQKGWTNVRIFGSVENRGMSHVGIPPRMIALETTPAYDILQLIYSSYKLIVLILQVSVGTLY